MTDLVAWALSQAARCKSETDCYPIQIRLQRLATPEEIEFLAAREGRWPDSFTVWLNNLFKLMTLHERIVRKYRRRGINDSIQLYSGDRRSDALLIAFCGIRDLLMLPIPVFLQYFREDACDIAVLCDPRKIRFAEGIENHSTSFRELIQALEHDLAVREYRSIRTIGVSMGGAAALAAGILLGAAKAVSICGHPPVIGRDGAGETALKELQAILSTSVPESEAYYCVHGAANVRDARSAMELSKSCGASLHPVEGMAEHAILFKLHDQGRLGGLFAEVGLL